MKNLPWYPHYAGDWLSSNTINIMTFAQQGAYIRLLCCAWMDETCTIPNDEKIIKKLLGWTKRDGDLKPVLACFKPYSGKESRLYNERLFQEFHTSKLRKSHFVERAKKGAAERWKDHRNPQKPLTRMQDRTTKGFQPISDDVRTVADKWFPPQ